ncbi:MAG: MBL fold metallo-hydrolase [Roseibium sp.]|uniref:MBL fold metallo-hydrolase n=1 Tax=Roseibium sp. TaxID=1936156 RepID=UPI003D9C31DA
MKHNLDFDPRYGSALELSPGFRRLTARNPGPFTFRGTNTYLIGTRKIVVVDPGPALEDHIGTIMSLLDGSELEAILVTHTHMDHSPGARLLQHRTGAPIVGCGPHRAARALMENEVNPLDSSGDKEHVPDRLLQDGDTFEACEASIEAIETPGHTANHLCFSIKGEDAILSADHVMGWSTSIVAPPDGSMRDYMASIEKLLARPEQTYHPGHGGHIEHAHDYVADLKQHRIRREQSILSEISGSDKSIPEIVETLYASVDPSLHPAAALSVFAHLEDLVERGLAAATPELSLAAHYKSRI